ncbi:MAG: tRNA lysidine(34) synthetase TilS [Acidobacteriota bacterium]|jgi:tRNA(Ile)-lysidine synthase
MTDLVEQVAVAARRDRLFEGVSRLLVGCSGGGDSVALLDILECLAPQLGLRLAVAHLHHGWRGAEADEDMARVERLAGARGLEFFGHRIDLSGSPGSREEAARDARLGFFGDTAQRWRADAVALGHTADDQLETVVLHLARGAGRRGLGGMRRRSQVDGVLLLRPLLDCRRIDLRAYATARALPWGEDSSNEDISLARNRLRRRLLADLQQINPGAVENVARAASLLADEEEWLDELASETLTALAAEEPFAGGLALDAGGLDGLPRPLRRRVVLQAIDRVRGHRRGIAFEHVEWVVETCGVAARDLPGVRVIREEETVRFLPLAGRRLATPNSR